VVSNPKVPVRIRQTLNIESGLNDGIAMPFLLLVIAIAESELVFAGPGRFLLSVLVQILIGIGTGLVIGYLGVKFMQWGQRSGWMSEAYQKITSLAMILLVYGAAELIGGNGFIAAFCYGIASSNVAGKDESEDLYEYAETELTVLMLLTFLLFGAVMLPPAIEALNPEIIVYAILSLTLVRMASVAISMIREKIRSITTLFMGWFGPRGVASILYVFIVLESESLPGLELIYAAAMVTVLFSIYAHGITAAPAADRYGMQMEELDERDKVEIENQEVSEMPLRAGGH
jgi:NhaP-type Na+/H+ or K+/H+ antiporter